MEVTCADDTDRRAAVRKHAGLNGLDYLEVSSDQRRLTVYFLDKAPERLTEGNVRISGGRRVRGEQIRVTNVEVCRNQDPERDDCLVIHVDRPGDFSCYTLCLVEADARGRPTDQPLAGFDPRYRCLEFGFKAGCPADLDCAAEAPCPPEVLKEPEISYLAKDYASFRQLIFDRMALLVPDWTERHVPDLGVALVEVLAYAGDHLSYYQDAVATEAYLDTANRRVSVRRHARLVDYRMHEGCNARALVTLRVDGDVELELGKMKFVTGLENRSPLLTPDELREIPGGGYEVFEPMGAGKVWLRQAHGEIGLYTWGEAGCCLPRGATSATLRDGWVSDPNPSPESSATSRAVSVAPRPDPRTDPANRRLRLEPGDLLILEEVRGPKTGNEADADPEHRHAVRLTRVERGVDELYDQPVLEVEWAAEDALPFPLCLSAQGPECAELEVSVARGNVIPVDHGRRTADCLGTVPYTEAPETCDCGCSDESRLTPKRFRPRLPKAPLVFREPIPDASAPASNLLRRDPREARPDAWLESWLPPDLERDDPCEIREGEERRFPQTWTPVFDLLDSGPDDPAFVVEVDDDRVGHLRFGDGELGLAPEAAHVFRAHYRLGGGTAGNVGADSIRHLVYADTLSGLSLEPRNPLPAAGGSDPEPVAEVKIMAPHAFRGRLARAVTPQDYASIVRREFPQVQGAAARLVWTGLGYAVQVAVDVRGQAEAPPELLRAIARELEPYRRIGHDLEVRPAVPVPLDLALEVCVRPGYLRAHVKAELLGRLGSRLLPGGAKGLFHPDSLSFGEGVYLSRIVAEARMAEGVQDAQVTRLQRYDPASTVLDGSALDSGLLPLGPFEVARLDNDASLPENGILRLDMRGGR